MTVKINGKVLPEEAVQYELSRLISFYAEHMDAAQVRSQMDLLKRRAVDQAIGVHLLMEEAKRLEIKVDDNDVEKSYQAMVDNAGDEEAFQKVLKERNLTGPVVKDYIRKGRRVDLLVEKISEGAREPTEDEMQRHFKKHAREYERAERAHVQHILVGLDSNNEADRSTARSRIETVLEKVKAGADFSKLAEEYSDCPSGESNGGSLGWFSRGMMVPEFDEVAFSMTEGDVSDVVETQFGFHILKKLGHENSVEADYDEVRENVRDFLRHVNRGELITAYVDDLKAKAVIENDGK